jgi:toxin YoeB
MEIAFSLKANEELESWKKSGNSAILKRLRLILESIKTTPFHGIGKPEPLKGNLAGFWSRRITKEYRLVYKVEKEVVTVIQVRYHY